MNHFRTILNLCLSITFLVSLVGAAAPAAASVASTTGVVIAQVYGGGGNIGSTYTHDYMLLFNGGAAAVDISTWSVQYASYAGTTWQTTNLTGSIPPGGFYLIQQAAEGGGTTPLPTPDLVGTIMASHGTVPIAPSTTVAMASAAVSGRCVR